MIEISNTILNSQFQYQCVESITRILYNVPDSTNKEFVLWRNIQYAEQANDVKAMRHALVAYMKLYPEMSYANIQQKLTERKFKTQILAMEKYDATKFKIVGLSNDKKTYDHWSCIVSGRSKEYCDALIIKYHGTTLSNLLTYEQQIEAAHRINLLLLESAGNLVGIGDGLTILPPEKKLERELFELKICYEIRSYHLNEYKNLLNDLREEYFEKYNLYPQYISSGKSSMGTLFSIFFNGKSLLPYLFTDPSQDNIKMIPINSIPN
jgi:hypothetical protein